MLGRSDCEEAYGDGTWSSQEDAVGNVDRGQLSQTTFHTACFPHDHVRRSYDIRRRDYGKLYDQSWLRVETTVVVYGVSTAS